MGDVSDRIGRPTDNGQVCGISELKLQCWLVKIVKLPLLCRSICNIYRNAFFCPLIFGQLL